MKTTTLKTFFSAAVLACMTVLVGCPDGSGTPDSGPDPVDGAVVVTTSGNELRFALEGVDGTLTAVQVPVELTGGQAIAARAAGNVDFNLVEAGLGDGPQSRFTLVVSDTRRLLLENGTFAVVELDQAAQVSVGTPMGVSRDGLSVELEAR